MNFKNKQVAEWSITKKNIKGNRKQVIIDNSLLIMNILMQLQLFTPTKYQFCNQEMINIDMNKMVEYASWLTIFDVNDFSMIDLQGQTTITQNKQNHITEGAIDLEFMVFTTPDDCVDFYCSLHLYSDNFTPNYMIHSTNVNLDYQQNHGRLNTALNLIKSKNFIINSYPDVDILAKVNGLEVQNNDYDNELIMYDEYGDILEWVETDSL